VHRSVERLCADPGDRSWSGREPPGEAEIVGPPAQAGVVMMRYGPQLRDRVRYRRYLSRRQRNGDWITGHS
jgi:hypothetical protein